MTRAGHSLVTAASTTWLCSLTSLCRPAGHAGRGGTEEKRWGGCGKGQGAEDGREGWLGQGRGSGCRVKGA
eukprot:405396-Rhodomonas_salina.1